MAIAAPNTTTNADPKGSSSEYRRFGRHNHAVFHVGIRSHALNDMLIPTLSIDF